MASMEPYRLSEAHVDAVGDLLSAAFLNAPGTRFMFPDPARRARLLPLLFTAMARRTVRNGEATALGAPLHAVALWMPPVREHPVEAEVAEAGMGAVALLDEEEAGRFTVFRRHFDTTHERLIDQPHWYLSFLAVDPGHQGHGAGTVLVRHMLDRVAPTGVPCYLESVDEANLGFYERLGFRVVEIGTVPRSDLRTWALRRD
jgi:ribosomal protein S18 acetylase RimI-like enzyme